MSATSPISPSERNRRAFSSPRPSMSMVPLATKCLTCWKTCPGQPLRLGQRVHTPSSGLTVGVPHAGHRSGGFGGGPRPGARRGFAVGGTTCRITSPGRTTITSPPPPYEAVGGAPITGHGEGPRGGTPPPILPRLAGVDDLFDGFGALHRRVD